ncbi:unnamed protein product [Chilo suppressalis]|uniref:Retinol dehydrogenase 11 n=1 Tax=Chilo suppressalis TaxID=168631 RepID=A0ABN8B9K5_CHISP|nr:unnamed protein product [Chilo suppressalis]
MVTVLYAAIPVSVIVAVGLLRKWRSRKWGKCVSNTCLKGKTYLITGATSGIGLETTKALVKRKARVIMACRDVPRAKELIADIRKVQPYGGELIPMHLDLASFESIEKFVEVIKAGFYKIDVLINNAGVAIPLERDEKTKEGFEIHFGVNHLGHFYLTKLLIELLKRASPSRIVIVSSSLHEKGVINFADLNSKEEIEKAKQGKVKSRHISAYQNSKLMNCYFMRALADRLKDTGVDVSACCPGFCYTSLFSDIQFRVYLEGKTKLANLPPRSLLCLIYGGGTSHQPIDCNFIKLMFGLTCTVIIFGRWHLSASFLLPLDRVQRRAARVFDDQDLSDRLDPFALRRDVVSLCIFNHICHGECCEEFFGLIPAAAFRYRTSRQKIHPHHLNAWLSTTLRFCRECCRCILTTVITYHQGAETVVYCASEYSIEGRTGVLYRDCAVYDSKYPFDKEVENRLWDVSEQLIKARKPIPID